MTLQTSLPADWYWKHEIYVRERSAIFARQWVYAAHGSELTKPGDYVTTDIAGHPIFLILDKGGALRGFHNVCRHRAAPLLLDECGNRNPGAVTCSYHGWSYSTQGPLLNAPLFDELPPCDKAELGLLPIRVADYRGLLFVNLDSAAPSFAEACGPLTDAIARSGYALEDYRHHARMTREGAFNWKAWVDGYQECYHCPTTHPIFQRDFKLREYKVENRERFSLHSCARRDPSESGTFEGLWLWVYPNLGLPCYEPCYYTLRVNPLSATRTKLTYDFHFREPIANQGPQEFMTFVEGVTREDLTIVERVQQNLQAGIYQSGFLNPTRENGVIYFQSLVRAAVSL